MNRTGENGATPNRSQRFFEEGEYWYYSTREGINIGPFDTQHEAETGVSDFIDFISHASPDTVASFARYGKAA